jgi:hypothetical protein
LAVRQAPHRAMKLEGATRKTSEHGNLAVLDVANQLKS